MSHEDKNESLDNRVPDEVDKELPRSKKDENLQEPARENPQNEELDIEDKETGTDNEKLKGDSESKVEKKESWIDFFITIAWALGIAMVLRTFLFQPFHIPSGSMEPNLVEGDYIITTKYSVGYGKYAASPLPFPVKKGRLFEREPQRGDVLVFRPVGNKKTYIKRLVGLPGDQIQVNAGILQINGQAIEQKFIDKTIQVGNNIESEIWTEFLPEGQAHQILDTVKTSHLDDTSIFTVPYGHYFLMGDNRDYSSDSRVPSGPGSLGAGYVPKENIIGRAEFVLLSAKPEFSIFKPWTWYHLRGDRFFKGLR